MTEATRDERRAIERAKQGDKAAFEFLFNLHRRRVFNLCYRMTNERFRAEDLTQETFLQVYRKLHTYRGDAAFSTWLHRIAVNVVLMTIRHNRYERFEVPQDANIEGDDVPMREAWESYDLRLANSVERIGLQRAITKLPPGYALVFILHDVEGYEHHEIADMLGCSTGNTKSQLHKARLKLRRLLQLGLEEGAKRQRRTPAATPTWQEAEVAA